MGLPSSTSCSRVKCHPSGSQTQHVLFLLVVVIVGAVMIDAEFNPIKNIYRLTRPRPLRNRLATVTASPIARVTSPSNVPSEILDGKTHNADKRISQSVAGTGTAAVGFPEPADWTAGTGAATHFRSPVSAKEKFAAWSREMDDGEGKLRYSSPEKMTDDHWIYEQHRTMTNNQDQKAGHHGNHFHQSNSTPRYRQRPNSNNNRGNDDQEKGKISTRPPSNREVVHDGPDDREFVAQETEKNDQKIQPIYWRRRTNNFDRQKIFNSVHRLKNNGQRASESEEFRRHSKPTETQTEFSHDPQSVSSLVIENLKRYERPSSSQNLPKYAPPPSFDEEEEEDVDEEMEPETTRRDHQNEPPQKNRPTRPLQFDLENGRHPYHHGNKFRVEENPIAIQEPQIRLKRPHKHGHNHKDDDQKDIFRENEKFKINLNFQNPDDHKRFSHHDDAVRDEKIQSHSHSHLENDQQNHDDTVREELKFQSQLKAQTDQYHYHHDDRDHLPKNPGAHHSKIVHFEATPSIHYNTPIFEPGQKTEIYHAEEPTFFVRGENSEEISNFDVRNPEPIPLNPNSVPQIHGHFGGRSIEVGRVDLNLPKDPELKTHPGHGDGQEILKTEKDISVTPSSTTPRVPIEDKDDDQSSKIEERPPPPTLSTNLSSTVMTPPPSNPEMDGLVNTSTPLVSSTVSTILPPIPGHRVHNRSDHFMIQESVQLNPNFVLENSQNDPLKLLENILKADTNIQLPIPSKEANFGAASNFLTVKMNYTTPLPPVTQSQQVMPINPIIVENFGHHANNKDATPGPSSTELPLSMPVPQNFNHHDSHSAPGVNPETGGQIDQNLQAVPPKIDSHDHHQHQSNAMATTPIQSSQISENQNSNGQPAQPQNGHGNHGNHFDGGTTNLQMNTNFQPLLSQNGHHHGSNHQINPNYQAVHQTIDQHVNNFIAGTDAVVGSNLAQNLNHETKNRVSSALQINYQPTTIPPQNMNHYDNQKNLNPGQMNPNLVPPQTPQNFHHHDNNNNNNMRPETIGQVTSNSQPVHHHGTNFGHGGTTNQANLQQIPQNSNFQNKHYLNSPPNNGGPPQNSNVQSFPPQNNNNNHHEHNHNNFNLGTMNGPPVNPNFGQQIPQNSYHHNGNNHFSPVSNSQINSNHQHNQSPQNYHHYHPNNENKIQNVNVNVQPMTPHTNHHHHANQNNFGPKILTKSNPNHSPHQTHAANYYQQQSISLNTETGVPPNYNYAPQNDEYAEDEEEEQNFETDDEVLTPPEARWQNYFDQSAPPTSNVQHHFENEQQQQQTQNEHAHRHYQQQIQPETYNNGGVPFQVLDLDDFLQNEPTTTTNPPPPPTLPPTLPPPPPPPPSFSSPSSSWGIAPPSNNNNNNNKVRNSHLILDILDEHLIRLTDWYKAQNQQAEVEAAGQEFEIPSTNTMTIAMVETQTPLPLVSSANRVNMGQMVTSGVLNGKLCSNLDPNLGRRLCKRKRRRRPEHRNENGQN